MFAILISFLFILYVEGIQVNFLENELPYLEPITSAIYDGQDSIYLMGRTIGFNSACNIYKSKLLTSGLLSDLQFLAEIQNCVSTGTVESDSQAHLFYFGLKYGGDAEVWKFDPETRNITEIKLPNYYSTYEKTTIRLGSKVLIFGREKGTLEFDLKTNEISKVDISNPFKYSTPTASIKCGNRVAIFAVAVNGEKSLVILGEIPEDNKTLIHLYRNSSLFLDTEKMEYTKAPLDFRFLNSAPSTVCDGKYLYIIGGYGPNKCSPDTVGIIRMDLNSLDWELLRFEEFEKAAFKFAPVPASVYVEKLNRIYFFDGAVDYNYGFPKTGENPHLFSNNIWYLDLNDLNGTSVLTKQETKETFSCCVKNDGVYPNPNSCFSFLTCQFGSRIKHWCPIGLVFDKETRNCNFPEFTECSTQFCKDKANGTYPDEYDENDFIICKHGEAKEFKCPDEFHFSKEKMHCVPKPLQFISY